MFSYVVHKKDTGSPSRTAPQPPVCSNLALHYTANNWLNWRGNWRHYCWSCNAVRQITKENTCVKGTLRSFSLVLYWGREMYLLKVVARWLKQVRYATQGGQYRSFSVWKYIFYEKDEKWVFTKDVEIKKHIN